jgi:hypothetical protein
MRWSARRPQGAPAPDLSARVAVVPLLDATLTVAGVTDGPAFAYHDGCVFPGGDGWVLPHWPWLGSCCSR